MNKTVFIICHCYMAFGELRRSGNIANLLQQEGANVHLITNESNKMRQDFFENTSVNWHFYLDGQENIKKDDDTSLFFTLKTLCETHSPDIVVYDSYPFCKKQYIRVSYTNTPFIFLNFYN